MKRQPKTSSPVSSGTTSATAKATDQFVPVADKKPEVTPEVKADTKKAEEKEPAKKEPAKKEPVKKTTAKKEVKVEAFIEYGDKQIPEKEIEAAVKKSWTKEYKKKVGDLKSIALYIKPEESKAYYVVNGTDKGSVEL